MNLQEAIATAHIHLETVTYRIYLKNAKDYPVELMNHSAPEWVLWISRSSEDPDRLFATMTEGYDINELAKWVKSFEPE